MALDQPERIRLLSIARAAIAAHVRGGRPEAPDAPPLVERTVPGGRLPVSYSGVFVSLYRQGTLRGCIGTLDGSGWLADAVAETAVSACSEDPRFRPLAPDELDDLELEISVLGPIELVRDLDTIEVGRHGLIVEQGRHRGLLLPQVAAEWRWTRHQFLAETCHKAGLREDAWKAGATIFRFEADVFSEA
ncbi:MAG: AmmeMemoRadiSam system protein A [Vicinamibacterales bacterium]